MKNPTVASRYWGSGAAHLSPAGARVSPVASINIPRRMSPKERKAAGSCATVAVRGGQKHDRKSSGKLPYIKSRDQQGPEKTRLSKARKKREKYQK